MMLIKMIRFIKMHKEEGVKEGNLIS